MQKKFIKTGLTLAAYMFLPFCSMTADADCLRDHHVRDHKWDRKEGVKDFKIYPPAVFDTSFAAARDTQLPVLVSTSIGPQYINIDFVRLAASAVTFNSVVNNPFAFTELRKIPRSFNAKSFVTINIPFWTAKPVSAVTGTAYSVGLSASGSLVDVKTKEVLEVIPFGTEVVVTGVTASSVTTGTGLTSTSQYLAEIKFKPSVFTKKIRHRLAKSEIAIILTIARDVGLSNNYPDPIYIPDVAITFE